jgi:hypothetical protein
MGNRGPFDWMKDDINLIVSEQVEFHKSKGREIFVVTGRDEVCRKITEDWLECIEYDRLIMRPKDDFRKYTNQKEIYEKMR